MRCLSNFGLILVLLLSAPFITKASLTKEGYNQCEQTVEHWASLSSSLDSQVKEDRHILRDLLFFLHIPRTGGRTYFHCFLRKLYSNSQECPRSYDKLRVDTSKPNCRLLSTHDDYSIMSKLAKEKTSAVTILRNPIERVFSTYEFSVEVAARFLVHPNLTSVGKVATRTRTKFPGVSTLEIWPWKYLVPWMREDLFARRDARKRKGESYTNTTSDNSYDMEDILIPLREYIDEPIVREIVHNGATFQIAGLTNNSHIPESHEVRHCVLTYPTLGKYVLKVAKERLDDMLYVGLTENHKESATMFANVVGAQVISQLSANDSNSEQSPSLSHTQTAANIQRNYTYKKDEAANKNVTVEKLMEHYESCISTLRKSQADRRVNSLMQISPANFTKETRRGVPEVLLQKIRSLNNLDMELYSYAQNIFARQQARVIQKKMVDSTRQQAMLLERTYIVSYGFPTWKVLSLGTFGILLLLLIFLSRRRTSKMKL